MFSQSNFLIVGLTGPVGAGSTSAAKFLSGIEVRGNTFVKSLNKLTSVNELANLEGKIVAKYRNIEQGKENIRLRMEKHLGTHKDAFLDLVHDPYIIPINRSIKQYHSALKIMLRRREVVNVLQDMAVMLNKDEKQLNDEDRNLFGCDPFIYISFSWIIIKIALCTFLKHHGKADLAMYFEGLRNRLTLVRDKLIVDYFERSIQSNFSEDFWSGLPVVDEVIKNKTYQLVYAFGLLKEEEIKSFSDSIKGLIKGYYAYLIAIKKIFQDIKNSCVHSPAMVRIFSQIMQDWGDNIRSSGNPFTSGRAEKSHLGYVEAIPSEINLLIKMIRFRMRFMDKEFHPSASGKPLENVSTWFAIEAFRSPHEVSFFRSRYSEFYLISVYASEERRTNRIKFFSKERDDRDQGKNKRISEIAKLDVTGCVLMSDIALNNDRGQTIDDQRQFTSYLEKVLRYVALIWRPGCVPPSNDELYMHMAYSMSCMSTCISRRVGAVIIGPNGYILGAGWNDVGEGQIGCGLRQKDDFMKEKHIVAELGNDLAPYFRDIINRHDSKYICFKDVVSASEIRKKIHKLESLTSWSKEQLEAVHNHLSIKRLEYCRALHAEENALLQLAKIGGQSMRGGIIYTTSFPCELCAKKIYQTGINRIVFTEPYPGNIAESSFLKEGASFIELRSFEGVKSYSFFKLYHPVHDKKDLAKMTIC